MSVQQFNQAAYGLYQPTNNLFPAPIVSNRAPTSADKAVIGQTWVNKPADDYYVLTSIVNDAANWQLLAAGSGSLDHLTSNSGVATASLGNINVVGGGATNITTSASGSTLTIAVISSPSFAGTVTAATGFTATTGNIVASTGNINATLGSISAGTTITAGTGITATTGNIVASTGNINATSGSMSANTSITAGTTITAGTGLTVTTGNLTVSSGNVTVSGTVTAAGFIGSGSVILHYIATSTTPYVALSTDYYIGIDCSAGAKTVQLPNAPTTGRAFVVKDYTGNAGANNITVTTVGGVVLIDGAATSVLSTNYQSIQLVFDGTKYEIY